MLLRKSNHTTNNWKPDASAQAKANELLKDLDIKARVFRSIGKTEGGAKVLVA
jgi:hypothetical protein